MLQWLENLNVGLGVIAAAALGALGYWRKFGKTRADVSADDLVSAQNVSQRGWLRDLEARLAAEQKLREQAESRERDLFAKLQDVRSHLRLLEEHNNRLERRYQRLVDIVSQTRPELREWLMSEPADLDPPKD